MIIINGLKDLIDLEYRDEEKKGVLEKENAWIILNILKRI